MIWLCYTADRRVLGEEGGCYRYRVISVTEHVGGKSGEGQTANGVSWSVSHTLHGNDQRLFMYKVTGRRSLERPGGGPDSSPDALRVRVEPGPASSGRRASSEPTAGEDVSHAVPSGSPCSSLIASGSVGSTCTRRFKHGAASPGKPEAPFSMRTGGMGVGQADTHGPVHRETANQGSRPRGQLVRLGGHLAQCTGRSYGTIAKCSSELAAAPCGHRSQSEGLRPLVSFQPHKVPAI
ncbi:Serine/Threonine-Protein Phosphatase 6 Regulatory Ankyrin Repeat Subunit C [Manis pentadactyla]|nr:Serine/Threonine-Protein Phosphatase 6 Regulatory Ankyrin Repeat Subunit C [Manis pentadactyla]